MKCLRSYKREMLVRWSIKKLADKSQTMEEVMTITIRMMRKSTAEVIAFVNTGKSLDELTKEITAFNSFSELINAKGGYRPSLDCTRRIGNHEVLANAYDRAQLERGDSRRAYRG